MRKITALLAIVGTVTILFSGLWVYAATLVWSNEVSVGVGEGYVLTLIDPSDGIAGDTFTFTGTLNYNGILQQGETVELYVNGVTTGLTDITDASGGYSIDWTTSTSGTYTFKTLVTVT